jgi:hypothetical protein
VGEIDPWLSGLTAVAAWFPLQRYAITSTGRFEVVPSGRAPPLRGQAAWHDDKRALIFNIDHPPIDGFLTVRAVILPEAGFGTEIWVHLEQRPSLGGRRALARLVAAIDAGLAHMRAELDRRSASVRGTSEEPPAFATGIKAPSLSWPRVRRAWFDRRKRSRRPCRGPGSTRTGDRQP